LAEGDFERRLDRLESIQEIEGLMAEYLYLVDREPDPERIAALFSADAIWEPRGNLALDQDASRGREEIRDLFSAVSDSMPFLAHYITNCSIELAEDHKTARGRWHAFELMSLTEPAVEVVQLARYENDFVRADDGWRLQHIRFEDTLSFPYLDGWAETRFVSLVSGRSFPHPGPSQVSE
jgi:hypothetical protein